MQLIHGIVYKQIIFFGSVLCMSQCDSSCYVICRCLSDCQFLPSALPVFHAMCSDLKIARYLLRCEDKFNKPFAHLFYILIHLLACKTVRRVKILMDRSICFTALCHHLVTMNDDESISPQVWDFPQIMQTSTSVCCCVKPK